ncbi:MAG: hypothetical protein Q8O84_04425 [Nanoarchaeota archaeon]|nr:hypothetical protein [Nanoarchaeota archaeon]
MSEEKDVFFVGAGFSKKYDIPLVSEWFNYISQFDKSAYNFLKDYTWLADEEKKSICNDFKLQDDLGKLFEKLPETKNYVKKDICQTIIDLENEKEFFKIIMNLIQWMLYLNYLKYFREKRKLNYYNKIMDGKNIVITPNYDNFIEREFPPEKVIKENGASKIENKYFGFSEEIGYPLILKLHGGHAYIKKSKMNIELEKQDFLFVYTNDNKEFIDYTTWIETHGDYGEDMGFEHNKNEYIQVIIPPLDKKSKNILFNLFQSYFIKSFEIAKEKLKEAKRIFIIGYSFNDLDNHLNELFKEVSTKEVYIVDIQSEDNSYQKKICEIFPKGFKYAIMTAEEFVNYYPDNLHKFFEKAIEINCPNH